MTKFEEMVAALKEGQQVVVIEDDGNGGIKLGRCFNDDNDVALSYSVDDPAMMGTIPNFVPLKGGIYPYRPGNNL